MLDTILYMLGYTHKSIILAQDKEISYLKDNLDAVNLLLSEADAKVISLQDEIQQIRSENGKNNKSNK